MVKYSPLIKRILNLTKEQPLPPLTQFYEKDTSSNPNTTTIKPLQARDIIDQEFLTRPGSPNLTNLIYNGEFSTEKVSDPLRNRLLRDLCNCYSLTLISSNQPIEASHPSIPYLTIRVSIVYGQFRSDEKILPAYQCEILNTCESPITIRPKRRTFDVGIDYLEYSLSPRESSLLNPDDTIYFGPGHEIELLWYDQRLQEVASQDPNNKKYEMAPMLFLLDKIKKQDNP